jgi:hypothetical protein
MLLDSHQRRLELEADLVGHLLPAADHVIRMLDAGESERPEGRRREAVFYRKSGDTDDGVELRARDRLRLAFLG